MKTRSRWIFGGWNLGFGIFFRKHPARSSLPFFLVALFSAFDAPSAVTYPLRWRWSNPTPHGNNIINMAYLPAPTPRAVQVTERGQIYTREDLILWTPRDSGTTNALR